MMNRALGCALLGSLAALLSGCGSSIGMGKGGPEFPSQAKLQDLAGSAPAAAKSDDRPTLAVDDWEVTAGNGSPTTEAESLVARLAKERGHKAKLEPELACTAREVARFFAAHQAFPDQQLQAYMAGVCGATVPSFALMVWSTPTDTVASAGNSKQWHEAIAKQLGPWLPEKARQLGAAEVSDGKNSVFAATVGMSDVAWESQSTLVNAAGQVELTGSVGTPAAFIYGLVNRGEYGVGECRTDPRVAPPRFHLTCMLDPNDSAGWVEIEALPPGRVLARGVAKLLLRREGAPLSFSAATKSAPPETVGDGPAFAARIVTLVNETRKKAGFKPLVLSAPESATSQKLAAHYFERSGEEDVSDTIALGLMAGWDVKGTIQTGNFFSHSLAGSLDPKRWLAYMLEQPSARHVLLDPKARTIAIGPYVKAEQKSVGALVNTYAFYESDDHRADLEHFVARLNERRNALGLVPAQVVNAPEVVEEARSIKTHHNAEGALQVAMQRVVNRTISGVEGYAVEATDLDHVELPAALLRTQLKLALGATHHRYPTAAWGTLVVLVVVLDASPPQLTASSRTPARL
jgi:hypothetical protein